MATEQSTPAVEPYYDDGQITLYCGDCAWYMLAVVQPGSSHIVTERSEP